MGTKFLARYLEYRQEHHIPLVIRRWRRRAQKKKAKRKKAQVIKLASKELERKIRLGEAPRGRTDLFAPTTTRSTEPPKPSPPGGGQVMTEYHRPADTLEIKFIPREERDGV